MIQMRKIYLSLLTMPHVFSISKVLVFVNPVVIIHGALNPCTKAEGLSIYHPNGKLWGIPTG